MKHISRVSADKQWLKNKHLPCQILLFTAGETNRNNANTTWTSQQALKRHSLLVAARGPWECGTNLPLPASSPKATPRLGTATTPFPLSYQPASSLPWSVVFAREVKHRLSGL